MTDWRELVVAGRTLPPYYVLYFNVTEAAFHGFHDWPLKIWADAAVTVGTDALAQIEQVMPWGERRLVYERARLPKMLNP